VLRTLRGLGLGLGLDAVDWDLFRTRESDIGRESRCRPIPG
jgi:hypothetical protein